MFFRNEYIPSTRKILIKESNIGLISSGFEAVRENRLKYVNNPLIGYFDESFPTAQFYIKGYEVRARTDRDKHGGGLIEFVKNGFISKRLKEYETKQSESICSELTIANRKWICLNIYRPPNPNNMNTFFDEITACLSKAAVKYENIIIMGDFNIDIKKSIGLW